MTMTYLLTAFDAFGKLDVNPSQLIVEHFATYGLPGSNVRLVTEIFSTTYRTAEKRLRALLAAHQPDAVIMLGVAQNRDAINLERIALNLDDARLPDNAGELRQGQPIVMDAPLAYAATLPLAALHTALQERQIPVVISNHAGAYLCNHVFYTALHEVAHLDKPIPCGFIHVPAMGDEAPKMPLAQMITAILVCLQTLAAIETANVCA